MNPYISAPKNLLYFSLFLLLVFAYTFEYYYNSHRVSLSKDCYCSLRLWFCVVTVHFVRSNLVKMHSKSPSVMAFCPVCLGILPYSWQNTSRDITCEQLLCINHR